MRNLLRRSLLLLVILVIFAGVVLLVLYLNAKPKYQGTLHLDHLKDSVQVIYDQYGIPHIYAENNEDLFRTFGFVHAQERIFQMDLLRRVGSGQLSDFFGEDLLEADQFFRTLGIKHYADQQAELIKADSLAPWNRLSQAYVDGINQYIQSGKKPPEYLLLRTNIEPFTINDIQYILGYMGFSFAHAYREDPVYNMILSKYGARYLEELDSDWMPGNEEIPVFPKRSADSLLAITFQANRVMDLLPVGSFIGSNSWVIGPQKTTTGEVILANDPHIGFAQPAVWYEAHLESPDYAFYGVHLGGIPFGIIGQNREVSWGMTMLENDDMDFYVEKVNPDNPNEVWATDHWEALKTRKEVIHIKGGKTDTLLVRESRHGPLFTDVLDKKFNVTEAVSVFWSYTKFPTHQMEAVYKYMVFAKSPQDIEKGTSMIHAPGLNIMVGDVNGNYGWYTTGKLFHRPDHTSGKLFLDGASGKDELIGYFDASYNPSSLNDPRGFIYSANNRPEEQKGEVHGGYYVPEDRAKRIVRLLSSREKWSVEDVKEMMLDNTSDVSPVLAKEILRVAGPNPSVEVQEMMDELQEWDGSYPIDGIAPTIYTKLIYEVQALAMEDELGAEVLNGFLSTHLGKRSLAVLVMNDTSIWFDNINTPEKENRKEIFIQALVNTHQSLSNQFGLDQKSWTWGNVHTLTHNHAMGEQAPFFNISEVPMAGSNEVINNLGFGLNGSGKYPVSFGPSKRRIVDFSNIESGFNVIPTGQSGVVISPHYDDQAALFNEGKYRRTMMNKEEIQAHASSRILLLPHTKKKEED